MWKEIAKSEHRRTALSFSTSSPTSSGLSYRSPVESTEAAGIPGLHRGSFALFASARDDHFHGMTSSVDFPGHGRFHLGFFREKKKTAGCASKPPALHLGIHFLEAIFATQVGPVRIEGRSENKLSLWSSSK